MKKILVLLLCLYIGNVSALEYSDYSDFSDYSEEFISSDDLTDVKTERRYKYYKYVKEYGPYEKESTLNSEYSNIDYLDFKYTDESGYFEERPSEEEGRIITSHTLYRHLKADDIKYIKIYNSNSKNIDLNYSNFNIIYKDKSIDYNIVYNNADESVIHPYGYMIIEFDENIDVRFLNIRIDVTASKVGGASIFFTLYNDRLNVGESEYIFSTLDTRSVNLRCINLPVFSNAFVYYYSDKVETTTPTIHYDDTVIRYTYKDKLYHKYKLVKEYTDDYLLEGYDDYIYIDEENYKD